MHCIMCETLVEAKEHLQDVSEDESAILPWTLSVGGLQAKGLSTILSSHHKAGTQKPTDTSQGQRPDVIV